MPIRKPLSGLILSVAAALSSAACKPEPPATPPRDVSPPPAPRADLPEEQRTPDLFGAWLVEAIEAPDKQPRDRSWPMVVLVGSRQIEIVSQCVTIGPFDYGRTVGGGLSVRQASPPETGAGNAAPPPAQCARALSPAEQYLPRLLFSAREVKVAADGSVRLSGEAGSLVLRRPAGALDNPRGQAPPPSVPPLLGAWRFLAFDNRPVAAETRMELLLRPQIVEWRSGCVNEARALRHERGRLVPGQVDPFPVCERGRSEAESAAGRLFAAPLVARMRADGRLRLEGSGVSADLAPLVR